MAFSKLYLAAITIDLFPFSNIEIFAKFIKGYLKQLIFSFYDTREAMRYGLSITAELILSGLFGVSQLRPSCMKLAEREEKEEEEDLHGVK